MLRKIITALLLLFCGASANASLKVGDLAPAFDFEDFSLTKAKGKIVVLYFYPKDNTSQCTVEAQQFAARHQEFTDLGADIVGVSTDDKVSHKKFKEKNQLPFALLSGDKKLTTEYGVSGLLWTDRVTFLIDREGKIAYIWHKVDVSKHAKVVLDKIKELAL